MTLSDNKNTNEAESYFCNPFNKTAVRTSVDPHGAAAFQLAADIENGVDITIYMVNDFSEILINDKGQMLTES